MQTNIGTAPIAETQTNFSSLTMSDIPVFTTNYLFYMHVHSVRLWYISEPQQFHCSYSSVGDYYEGHLKT